MQYNKDRSADGARGRTREEKGILARVTSFGLSWQGQKGEGRRRQ